MLTTYLLPTLSWQSLPGRSGPVTRSSSKLTTMDGAMETQDDTVHQHIELLSLPVAAPEPLPANVEDIDTEDTDNPQMVAEYVTEIYSYMRDMEVRSKTVVVNSRCGLNCFFFFWALLRVGLVLSSCLERCAHLT
jgi:hypothetical protein